MGLENPGSYKAGLAGCTCPVMDNNHGNGYKNLPGVFVYSGGCKYHDEVSEAHRERKETKDELDK